MSKKNEKIIYYIVLFVMIFIPLVKITSYVCNYIDLTKNIFVINQVYVLYLSIPILLITYISSLKKKKIDIKDQIIFFLIITAVESSVFAVNIRTSIFGFYGRYEGLLTIISYYLLFLNCKMISNEKYKENIVKVFLTIGAFQTLYACLQVFTDLPFVIKAEIPYMGMALCGNPNFYGSYSVMLTCIASVLYLLKKEKKYLFLTIFFFIGLVLASSTGPFLGYILAMLFFIIVYKVNVKRVGVLILIFSISFSLVESFVYYKYTPDINYTIKGDIDILNNKLLNKKDSSNGLDNGRLDIWFNSLPLIKEYFVVGAGLDNYYYIFKKYPLDKAHNIYLQILITNGLLSLLLYLLLLFLIFIKKHKDPLMVSLYIAFIGYSIQGFANISVIDVAPYFFIFMGLICASTNNKIDKCKVQC